MTSETEHLIGLQVKVLLLEGNRRAGLEEDKGRPKSWLRLEKKSGEEVFGGSVVVEKRKEFWKFSAIFSISPHSLTRSVFSAVAVTKKRIGE